MRNVSSLLSVHEARCRDKSRKTRGKARNDIRYFPSLTVWCTYDKRGSVPTINILLLHRRNSTRKARSRERYKGARLSASKFKVLPPLSSPHGGGLNWLYNRRRPMPPAIHIYLRLFSFLDRSGGERRRWEGGRRRCIACPLTYLTPYYIS